MKSKIMMAAGVAFLVAGCGSGISISEDVCPNCGLRIPTRPQGDPGPSCAILIVLIAALVAVPAFVILRLIFGWL